MYSKIQEGRVGAIIGKTLRLPLRIGRPFREICAIVNISFDKLLVIPGHDPIKHTWAYAHKKWKYTILFVSILFFRGSACAFELVAAASNFLGGKIRKIHYKWHNISHSTEHKNSYFRSLSHFRFYSDFNFRLFRISLRRFSDLFQLKCLSNLFQLQLSNLFRISNETLYFYFLLNTDK